MVDIPPTVASPSAGFTVMTADDILNLRQLASYPGSTLVAPSLNRQQRDDLWLSRWERGFALDRMQYENKILYDLAYQPRTSSMGLPVTTSNIAGSSGVTANVTEAALASGSPSIAIGSLGQSKSMTWAYLAIGAAILFILLKFRKVF